MRYPNIKRGFGRSLAALGLGLAVAAGFGCGTMARAQESPAPSAAKQPSTQRLVFATYYYWYQGDPRKALPTAHLRNSQGVTTLTHHPWESVGPWISFDRAQWHRNNFQLMAGGGIDVALAVYRGDVENRRAYAIKGLDVMAQALKELRTEGPTPLTHKAHEHPQIALGLDLGGLATQYGGPVDLKQQDVQRSLYGMIRDFYLHVPAEFRASVQLPASQIAKSGAAEATGTTRGVAYIVRLMSDAAVKDADNSFLTYCNRRFAQEFGAGLVWVGTPELATRVTALDAVAPYPAAQQGAVLAKDGWIGTGSFGPGYDASSQGAGAKIRSRDNGQQTIVDFRRIIQEKPEWVFIDSWNNFAHGSDVAPSLEYGLLYRDLVQGGVFDYKQSEDYAADFLRATAPRAITPGRIYQVEVVVQNSGTEDWNGLNLASLSYQWLQNGKPVGERGASVVSRGQSRGEVKTYVIGVTAPLAEGKPLPPGEYELEFRMTRRQGTEELLFDAAGAAPHRIPVTVGPSVPARPYWLSSTMPTMTRSGASYPAKLRVRNDGADTWKQGTYAVGYRWRKVSTYLKGGAQDSDTVLVEGPKVTLPADVEPGKILELEVPVATVDAQGKPFATWSPKDDWDYLLEWDLHDGQKYLSSAGASQLREPVEVLDRDPAPHFLGCNLPPQLVAGRTEKITVGLLNRGPETWKKDRDKVVVHWYYMDGTEAAWNDDSLPLPEDVPPYSRFETQVPIDTAFERAFNGEEKKKGKKNQKFRTETITRPVVLREVPVRVPYYFGPMYCVLDFSHDGLHASTGLVSKGSDILVIPVNIFSPTFTPLPINAYYNLDGISQDVDRTDGDLDGRGNTLPAEYLPPYVNRPAPDGKPNYSPLYPSGLWVKPLNDLEASRVCFSYPNKNNQVPNMVRAQGQQLRFAGIQRTAVHLMAICTEPDVEAEFVLTYSDGSTATKKLKLTHWNEAPKHGERVAFKTPHRHTARGDDTQTSCYINHYTIPTDTLHTLVGIDFPKQPAVKILAVTLESSSFRASP
ncbi:MAG: hypothetical protein ACK47B_14370 [Armatimonadota bacterium]